MNDDEQIHPPKVLVEIPIRQLYKSIPIDVRLTMLGSNSRTDLVYELNVLVTWTARNERSTCPIKCMKLVCDKGFKPISERL